MLCSVVESRRAVNRIHDAPRAAGVSTSIHTHAKPTLRYNPAMPAARRLLVFVAAILLFSLPLRAQFHEQIEQIAAQAHGRVGVACSLPGKTLDCDLAASAAYPTQSTYKLPIAMVMLHEVEQGKFSLDQTVHIVPSQLAAPDDYSPLRDEHPHGAVDVSIREMIEEAVTHSDNVAADTLLRTEGGGAVATAYFRSIGIDGIHIVYPEQIVNRDERLQYSNSATPHAYVALMRRLADNSPLSPEHTKLLMDCMYASHTGDHRLKALLPVGTPVADKTGTAGQSRPTVNATNDFALITLPNGQKLAVAVLVADATAPFAVRERVIAEIGQAIYTAATH
jgi:beta-lactamase class A